jgi:hypothetical protein
MQNKVTQNKEFRSIAMLISSTRMRPPVQKPKSINELLKQGGERLRSLRTRSDERGRVREHVCRALPAELAANVVSAGLEEGKLTIGVAGGAWAARLRYVTETLKLRVGSSMGIEIETIRIKVVPPLA